MKMLKKVREFVLAIELAHKWKASFREVLRFVRSDRIMQKELAQKSHWLKGPHKEGK